MRVVRPCALTAPLAITVVQQTLSEARPLNRRTKSDVHAVTSSLPPLWNSLTVCKPWSFIACEQNASNMNPLSLIIRKLTLVTFGQAGCDSIPFTLLDKYIADGGVSSCLRGVVGWFPNEQKGNKQQERYETSVATRVLYATGETRRILEKSRKSFPSMTWEEIAAKYHAMPATGNTACVCLFRKGYPDAGSALPALASTRDLPDNQQRAKEQNDALSQAAHTWRRFKNTQLSDCAVMFLPYSTKAGQNSIALAHLFRGGEEYVVSGTETHAAVYGYIQGDNAKCNGKKLGRPDLIENKNKTRWMLLGGEVAPLPKVFQDPEEKCGVTEDMMDMGGHAKGHKRPVLIFFGLDEHIEQSKTGVKVSSEDKAFKDFREGEDFAYHAQVLEAFLTHFQPERVMISGCIETTAPNLELIGAELFAKVLRMTPSSSHFKWDDRRQ